MPLASSATPLLALDCVAIDTETTGLDARKARIVEFALVPIRHGRLNIENARRRLLKPDVAIPAQATRIHGIDAAAIADAPSFAEYWTELAGCIGDRPVIGHSVGFDIAVIERECARAGLAWRRPRTLDTRLLAEILAPDLAGYSLDHLAAWLEVEATDRHSALGDAKTAGRVFLALVPRLREINIRTLAEAERACGALSSALEQQHRAGWAEPASSATRREPAYAPTRVDSYPYRHRVREVMSAPPKYVHADAALAHVLECMAGELISSLIVRYDANDAPPSPSDVGILTERDVMRMLATSGGAALGRSAGAAASRPVVAIPADAFAFLAAARMNRLRIRHLGVTDETGRIIGVLSARDLLRLRSEEAHELGDAIESAEDVHGLSLAWAKLPSAVASLLDEGLTGIEIAALVSHQLCLLTARAGVLAERYLSQSGYGPPPCPYALAVLGSAGRGESLLAMDQDNALIFSDIDDPDADRWFAALGTRIADILHEVGVPYCKGGVMASNRQWRGSVSDWRERIGHWIGRSKPSDLLAVDIFFDLRGVHGDVALAERVWREAFDAAKGQAAFAKLLVETAGASEAGLSLFGGFRTERGRIDVKKAGLFGIVSAARALAICHHAVERSTRARLDRMLAGGVAAQDLGPLGEALNVFLGIVARQQIEDMKRGIPPSNAVEVNRLASQDRDRLRKALKATAHVDQLVRDFLFKA